MIPVLLADDETLIRAAMATMLDLDADFHVVAHVGSGEELIAGLAPPSGRRRAGRRRHHRPAHAGPRRHRHGHRAADAHSGRRHADRHQPRPPRLPEAGARRRRAWLPTEDDLGGKPRRGHPHAIDGASIDEIAKRVHLSPGTTRNYLSSAITKPGVSKRHEAALEARSRGWIWTITGERMRCGLLRGADTDSKSKP